MSKNPSSPFSAAEQGLGYIYQTRFALLKILTLPEDDSIYIEKDDDLEFVEKDGKKSLASLKHKSITDTLTDLSTDFWKSVRIWLECYNREGKSISNLRFFLFTTGKASDSSFLRFLLQNSETPDSTLALMANEALESSTSKLIAPVRAAFDLLSEDEKEDFLSRITIFDSGPRITDIPEIIIDQHLRTIRREFRKKLFERLEGWWSDTIIRVLAGERKNGIYGHEVSDKLSALAEEYRSDNLPINFRGALPDGKIDVDNDPRIFVEQLRCIGTSANRIQSAIIDYYRAFEQRSNWARENLLIANEIEEYEDRLVDEWARYKDVVFENLSITSSNDEHSKAGRELYQWAEFETGHLKIRERVTEPYVVRGGFHILANTRPLPRIHWHPHYLQRLKTLLEVSE